MEEIRISAEQFRRELTELLSQAGYGGASIIVERHGTPLAALIPYQEYQKRATIAETSENKSSVPEPFMYESSHRENSVSLRETAVTYDARPMRRVAGVLTLEEAAVYLRTPQETIRNQAEQGDIPARKLGDSWRFSQTALEQWLQPQNSRSALLAQAGIFAGDRSLDEMLTAIYAQRGRPEMDSEGMAERLL